ncbi:MAG TPA: helix-turn-helix domain-containing protein [Longimicrobiaceae bacterium]|jgi:transcriptional regulator with XRE-family HTH domain
MKKPARRRPAETLSENEQLQEIDERHYISQQVFFRREDRDWSQERLAHAAGLTQAQVATLEAGQANPTLRTLVKVAAAFGCAVRDLITPESDEADGCTTADREAAELLRELARHAQWSERSNAEFTVAQTESSMGGRAGLNAFHARAVKRFSQRGSSVNLDLRRAANVEIEEYTEAAEL